MKALILAGGSGTRLRPITHTSSKQLVPVANKPILFYALEHMADAGVKDVGMIVGDTAPEVQEAVGDGSRWGLNVTYIEQEAPLGLAHTVLIAREFLADDDFIMYLGDNLLRQGVAQFVRSFEASRKNVPVDERVVAQILLAKVPDPHRFGVVELDENGEVRRLVEKPKVPPSDLALVGVYLFDKTIHEAVASIKPSPRGELEITDSIQWMIDHGRRVRSEVVDGYWKDLGELEALLDGNSLMLDTLTYGNYGTADAESKVDQRVLIEEGAQIIRSIIRGPAIIGRNAVVMDSYVGPFTSIGADCEIVKSEVEHSMLLERAKLNNVRRLEDSLLGREAEVTRSERLPVATRLMIGDHSRVDLKE
jgi:glucose-1-phosphate thymidylyltransferase